MPAKASASANASGGEIANRERHCLAPLRHLTPALRRLRLGCRPPKRVINVPVDFLFMSHEMDNYSAPVDQPEFITRRDIADLKLDVENPRINASPKTSEDDLVRLLYETQALDELALSLARNGYFLEEPIVVVPDGAEKYTVVEGNRRVAAIKILLDSRLRKLVGADDWPVLNEDRQKALARVPTVLYPDRGDVVPYLGFRHITGIKTWDPLAKARYVASLVDAGRGISDIEQSVGDSARAVKRLYQSFVGLKQIERDLGLETKTIEKSFSLLEVALSQSSIKLFVGLSKNLPGGKMDHVFADEKLSNLRELISWIFGDPDQRQERIITDSRQIPSRLAPVIGDPEALDYLRKTRDLEGAYEFSGGERNVLLRQLAATKRAAQRVLGLIPSYKEDAEVREAVVQLKPLFESLVSSTGE